MKCHQAALAQSVLAGGGSASGPSAAEMVAVDDYLEAEKEAARCDPSAQELAVLVACELGAPASIGSDAASRQ